MNNEKYNGWTNYATWKMALEWFDNADAYDEPTHADACRELVECVLESNCDYLPALDLAMAFLDDVNWQEIAEHINQNIVEEV